MARDPKIPAHHTPAASEHHSAATSSKGHGGGRRGIEQIQADLDDARAELNAAMPNIEAESAKQRRQLERIAAAKMKWANTHEPDDPFDPHQFEPPMLPIKADQAMQRDFHALHYHIAKLQAELAQATKAAIAPDPI